MHTALLAPDVVDDFVIVRATAFTHAIQLAMTRGVLRDENLPLLEWRMLFSIARFGSCHLAYITARTSIDAAHGSRALSALEKKGLVVRQDDPENRRRKLISLTPDGVTLFNRVWPRAQAKIKTVTDQLSADDFAELKRLLDLVNEAAKPLVQGSAATKNAKPSNAKPKAAH